MKTFKPKLTLSFTLVLLALSAGVAPAAEPSRVAEDSDNKPGIALAGNSVVYGLATKDFAADRVVPKLLQAGVGVATRDIYVSPLYGWPDTVGITASESSVGIEFGTFSSDEGRDPEVYADFFAGQLGGTMQTFPGCYQDLDGFGPGLLDISGSRVAWIHDDPNECGRKPSLRVRDLFTSVPTVIVPLNRKIEISQVSIAGTYVASKHYSRHAMLVNVFDAITGKLIRAHRFSKRFGNIDLQEDGKLLVASLRRGSHRCVGARVEWFDPGASGDRHVFVKGTCSLNALIADDRIALVRPLRTASAEKALIISDLAKSNLRIVTTDVGAKSLQFDFDGKHVAWAQPDCLSTPIYISDLATLGAPQPAFQCPVSITQEPVVVDSKGRFELQVNCPRGCRGSFEVVGPSWLTKSKPFESDNYLYSNHSTFFVLSPGTSVQHMELSDFLNDRLRRRLPASIRLAFTSNSASVDGRTNKHYLNLRLRR